MAFSLPALSKSLRAAAAVPARKPAVSAESKAEPAQPVFRSVRSRPLSRI